MTARHGLAVAAFLAGLVPGTAHAFVQTMTCTESGEYQCRAGEVAKPVHWPTRCVSYYINELGTEDIADNSRTIAAIQRSFTTWSEVPGSEFVMEYAGLTDEDRAEHISSRGDGGNANIIVFRDDNWPYASATAFAITSVTFDPVTGVIADADMELNSQYHQFTTGDTSVIVDVANTVTHEAGHFLGLDHSPVVEATMYKTAPNGETQKRDLDDDDIEGLFAAYPPVGVTPTCEDLPDYFHKPGAKQDKGCCATTGAPSRAPGPLWLLVGAALLLRRRRRKS